uniref:Heat shock 70 kDa protein 12A n=1 Tax=Poecilia mexicana TaxID=48701 RepID=A0A3B3WPB0_9TELE
MGESYIISIDFGTTYSGYAFSLTSREEEVDPHVKFWGEEVGLETPKTPTCILFDEHQQFVSFGYAARQTYLRNSGKESRAKFFFDRFKMSLYGKVITTDLTITAANGREMKALTVFKEALRFLKEDALKTIQQNTEGMKFTASDFTWVLTVPAIWDHSAKQFMREAATQAGIVTDGTENNLVFALEPEAASVYCKKLPSEGFIAENRGESKLDQSPGTQYIIVDCGGGTIDITVHEVLEGGFLKELHKASGNDMGGQTVDKKYPSEVRRIIYDFTLFKRRDEDMEICPLNLGMIARQKQDMAEYFKRVQGQKLRYFFEESLWSITKSLKEILYQTVNTKYILLVGGFAESQILQRHIKDEFIDNCKVLCPFRPQEAIVNGAFELGRNQGAVASRKSNYTYGDFGWNETKELTVYPLESDQTKIILAFYRTKKKKNPMYVDETDVEKMGSFVVESPDTTLGLDCQIVLEIKFGFTELMVTGTDRESGSVHTVNLNFMTN